MSALATNSDKPHPIGGRRGAWPGFKTRAWPQCRWAAARPGWASPSDTSAAGLEGTGVPEGTCRGTGGRRRGLAGLRDDARATHQQPGADGVEGAGETCRGAGGRRQGLAGQRVDAPSEARGADDSRAGRRPRAHQAARHHEQRRGRAATHEHTKQPGTTSNATGGPPPASTPSSPAPQPDPPPPRTPAAQHTTEA